MGRPKGPTAAADPEETQPVDERRKAIHSYQLSYTCKYGTDHQDQTAGGNDQFFVTDFSEMIHELNEFADLDQRVGEFEVVDANLPDRPFDGRIILRMRRIP